MAYMRNKKKKKTIIKYSLLSIALFELQHVKGSAFCICKKQRFRPVCAMYLSYMICANNKSSDQGPVVRSIDSVSKLSVEDSFSVIVLTKSIVVVQGG